MNFLNNLTHLRSTDKNIYYRKTKQLKEYLENNGFAKMQVTRVRIGEKYYYNIKFRIMGEYTHKTTSHERMGKLLNIKHIGLIDYSHINDETHITILIDEKELDSKYLVDGNLQFNTKDLYTADGLCLTAEMLSTILIENGSFNLRNFSLRFEDTGLSYPIKKIEVDYNQKEITFKKDL